MFSRRVPAELSPNRIALARERAEVAFDLTATNPTACGIAYPDRLLDALADPRGLAYRPDPRGLASAREAVAAEYSRLGAEVAPDRIVLAASTSEAYAFLFKLLCEPGEAVLVPTPSYPLFEHLARVEGVGALPYRLDPAAEWRLDPHELERAPASVRAVVVVHPNNPTGSWVHPDDRAALDALCARRGWALIADEVFLDYPLAGGPGSGASFAGQDAAALTFALGGLSKCVGLPQLKLAWIVARGPEALVAPALARLEFVADTFLSVATPVQLALPALLREGAAVRAAIRRRCEANLAAAPAELAAHPAVALPPPGGGWSAVMRYPAVVGEEELVVELLERDGVAVHPGFFFDFPHDGILVLSLLPPPEVFAEGFRRVLRRIAAHLGGA
ncbi:MAG TPA: pyridoxal phosphate-dependent aminotransferase [Thermoanaerobaculaceae bacterium]|nr:pyridoxal phosphate-dependent aminotransferase [Thermoanaerobaculaceae bacterium]